MCRTGLIRGAHGAQAGLSSGAQARISSGLLVGLIAGSILAITAWSAPPAARAQDAPSPASASAAETDETPEAAKERIAAERFLELLKRRPRLGTALDKVYGYHVSRGTLDAFSESLEKEASTSGDGNLWLVLGMVQMQRGHDAQAVVALEKAEAALPKEPLASYYLGKTLLLVGEVDDAAAAFRRAIDRKPPRADLLAIFQDLGRVYQRTGRNQEALEVWKQLETQFPGDLQVREQIAAILAEEGATAAALERYTELSQSVKDRFRKVELAIRAAQLKAQLGKTDEALADFEQQLAQVNPDSWLHRDVRRRIEEVFWSSGDIDGLVVYYTKWVEKHPDDVDAMMRTARVLAAQRRLPEAEKWFRDAIKKAPSTVEPRLALVEALAGDDRYQQAAQEMGELVELQPDNPDYIVRWGELIFNDGKRGVEERRREAGEVWRRMLVKRGDDPVTVSRVADLLRASGDSDGAIQQYQAAIKLAPSEPQYREYLGEFLYQLNRKDEALAAWRELASGERETRDNLARLSEVLSTFKFDDEALETMAKVCEMKPTFGHRARYAELLRGAKRFDDALAQLDLAEPLAEDPELRELVITERIKNYQASGSLEERIEQAEDAVAGDKAGDATAWRMLALLHDADRKFEAACQAIAKSTELAPGDIAGWEAAATLQERAGRFGEAIESYRKLATLDRRYLSSYLTQIASLEMRLGNVEAALETGEQLIASAPGNSEHYRFFADLCFRTGNAARGLDVLRRNVRGNPNDSEALVFLARTLAEEFETDEAMELYWRAFDQASDVDDRIAIITPLTELYLRTNRFEAFVERLQTLGREQNKPRDATLWAAAAHQAAGDLGMAKQLLEGLAREDSRDTKLFEQLVALARAEYDFETAVEYQRRLVAAAPTPEAEYLLGNLLLDLGEIDEAEAIWLKLSQRGSDHKALHATIATLVGKEQYETAAKVIEKALAQDPSDWELLSPAMITYVRVNRDDEARQIAERVLALDIDQAEPTDETREAIKKQKSRRNNKSIYQYDPYELLGQPIRMSQIVPQLKYALTGDSGNRGYNPFGAGGMKPMCFQDVYLTACLVPLATGGEDFDSAEFVKARVTEALKSGAARELWQAIAFMTYEDPQVSYSQTPNEQFGRCLKMLVDQGDSGAAISMIQYIMVRRNRQVNNGAGKPDPLSKEEIAEIRRLSELASKGSFRGNLSYYQLWLAGELARAGAQDEADKLIDSYVELAKTKPNTAMALVQAAAVLLSGNLGEEVSAASVKRAIPLLRDGLKELQLQATTNPSGIGQQFASIMHQLVRLDQLDGAIELTDEVLGWQAAQTAALRPSQRMRAQNNASNALNYGISINRQYVQHSVTFPPVTPCFGAEAILTVHGLYSAVKDDPAKLEQVMKAVRAWAAEPAEDPNLSYARLLSLASMLYWSDDRKSIDEPLVAAEKLQVDSQAMTLMRSKLLYEAGDVPAALALIEKLRPTNQQMMVDRELAILQLVLQRGDLERAKESAQKLFALRLDSDTEFKLADLMYQLGMRELGDRMMGRIRRRAGGKQDTLAQLMNRYVEANDLPAAVEIARQVVRRTSPRGSQNYYTAENQQHERAVQVLHQGGALNEMIEQYEGLVKRSPKSTKLVDKLCAFYEAAGRRADAEQLRLKAVETTPDDPRSLYAAGQQLARLQKYDEASDKFIAAIVKSPTLLDNNYYEMQSTFRQAKTWDKLADAVVEVGLKKFTQTYRLGELIQEMGRDADNSPALNRLLYAAISDLDWPQLTNMMHSYSQLKFKPDEKLIKLVSDKLTAEDANFENLSHNTFVWSRSSDGSTTGFVNGIAAIVTSDEALAERIVQAMQARLEKSEGELFCRVLLCMILGEQKKFAEVETAIAPVLEKKDKQPNDAQAIWSVASMLAHRAKQPERAAKLLEAAGSEVLKKADNSDFQYSALSLLAYSYEKANRRADAHRILVDELRTITIDESQDQHNPGYGGYRYISSLAGLAERFLEMGYPAEAFLAHRKAYADEALLRTSQRWGGTYLADRKDRLAEQITARKNAKAILEILGSALDPTSAGEVAPGDKPSDHKSPDDKTSADVLAFLSAPVIERNSLLDTQVTMPLEQFAEGLAKDKRMHVEMVKQLEAAPLPDDTSQIPLKTLVTRLMISTVAGNKPHADAAAQAIVAWSKTHDPPDPAATPPESSSEGTKETEAAKADSAATSSKAKDDATKPADKVLSDEFLLAMAAERMPPDAVDPADVIRLIDRAMAAAKAEKEMALVSSLQIQVAKRVAADDPARARKMLQEALDELLPPSTESASLTPAKEAK